MVSDSPILFQLKKNLFYARSNTHKNYIDPAVNALLIIGAIHQNFLDHKKFSVHVSISVLIKFVYVFNSRRNKPVAVFLQKYVENYKTSLYTIKIILIHIFFFFITERIISKKRNIETESKFLRVVR